MVCTFLGYSHGSGFAYSAIGSSDHKRPSHNRNIQVLGLKVLRSCFISLSTRSRNDILSTRLAIGSDWFDNPLNPCPDLSSIEVDCGHPQHQWIPTAVQEKSRGVPSEMIQFDLIDPKVFTRNNVTLFGYLCQQRIVRGRTVKCSSTFNKSTRKEYICEYIETMSLFQYTMYTFCDIFVYCCV